MNHSNPMLMRLALTLPLSLLLAPLSWGLPEDRAKPIQIDANRAILDEREGTTTYIGNVELVQGTLLILADKIEIFSIDKEVDRVIAEGKPAYVEDQPDPEKAPVKARANTIRYFVKDEKLELETNASIDQDGATVNSDTIVYYVKSQRAEANSADKDTRVRMVIPPREEKP